MKEWGANYLVDLVLLHHLIEMIYLRLNHDALEERYSIDDIVDDISRCAVPKCPNASLLKKHYNILYTLYIIYKYIIYNI